MVLFVDVLSKDFTEVSPKDFYRKVFPSGALDQPNAFTKGAYCGIACEFTGIKINNLFTKTSKELTKRYTVTDDLSVIDQLLQSDNFIIISPISYVGKSRSTKNAAVMYAFTIEIDNLKIVDGKPYGYEDLVHQMQMKILPMANYIVASGNGLHLYYLFEDPLILDDNVKKSLMRFKKAITPLFWNKYVTDDYTDDKIQYESAFQGFRMAGGVAKNGERTRVFEVSTHPVSIEDLNNYVDDKDKIQVIRRSNLSLLEAKDKYPEWYQKRIVEKQPKGHWICKRDLYDWWKHRISAPGAAMVGHRFHCLMMLAIYAIKCDISESELEHDIFSFLEPFDELSVHDDNRFTEKDISDALQAFYDKGLITYPINSIVARSGISIQKNKRNGRKQSIHVKFMNNQRRFKVEMGECTNGGRPNVQKIVQDWRKNNPDGKKSDCIKATGLSKPTVYKWW